MIILVSLVKEVLGPINRDVAAVYHIEKYEDILSEAQKLQDGSL
jgi:hypothetical protein